MSVGIEKWSVNELSVQLGRNQIELRYLVSPCEFNLKSAASAIVTHTTDLNIFHGLTVDV